MGLYPGWSPWLSKPEAARRATEAIVESAIAARGAVGYLDWAQQDDDDGGPFWLRPRARSPLELIAERDHGAGFDACERSLGRTFDFLGRSAGTLGAGSFIFVLSDFLDPPSPSMWLSGIARRWELVPVVIQDPTWEQSFPAVGPVLVLVVDPIGGEVLEVRLRRSEARAERERRERARADLLSELASIALDPILLDSDDPAAVGRAFVEWAERRHAEWRRR
jgi:hypothetical protein